MDAPQPCQCIFGANSYPKSSANYSSSVNRPQIQAYRPTHMCTGIMTTTAILLSLSAWKPLSTIVPTPDKRTRNTVGKHTSSAHPSNIIDVGNFGQQQHEQQEHQEPRSSNTSTSLTPPSLPKTELLQLRAHLPMHCTIGCPPTCRHPLYKFFKIYKTSSNKPQSTTTQIQ